MAPERGLYSAPWIAATYFQESLFVAPRLPAGPSSIAALSLNFRTRR